ncbi:hypothetical protein [Planktotalea sp.]|uniref:hypothetical protein n=1 Tax=Planktotalea sp. TaxID=2029877 RepID=UPI003D6C6D24
MRFILSVAFAVIPSFALAGEYDGIYRPVDYKDWDCKNVGMDGGALQIKDGQFFGVESACDLTNPTPVRDMNATLFDMICSAEGETFSERILIMHTEDGVLTVRDQGYVSELTRCGQ